MIRRSLCGVGLSAVSTGSRNVSTTSDLFQVIARRKDGPLPTPTPTQLPDFTQTKTAYKHMTNFELARSLAVLKMCRIRIIRDNGPRMLATANKVFGEYLAYNTFVRWTMYKHFCAGENDREVRQAMQRLEKIGVGSILDYAAEADVEPTEGAYSKLPPALDAHIKQNDIPYPAKDEEVYDVNMKLYAMSVTQASLNNKSGSWATCALKVTAFCDPILLSRASAVDLTVRRSWATIVGLKDTMPLEECRVVIDLHNKEQRFATVAQFKEYIAKTRKMSAADVEALITRLDAEGAGVIDYFKYTRIVSDALLPSSENPDAVPSDVQAFIADLPQLTEVERQLWCVMMGRVNTVLSLARDLKVRIMIDAEHSFYQAAIDHVVRAMQRSYNTSSPIIYGTFQCYIRFARARLENDMERARHEGWCWAGKIVRGAYMVQESELAAKHNYQCPVFCTVDGTHKSYNGAAGFILEQMQSQPNKQFAVLFGTHNQTSLEIITKAMSTMTPNKGEIAFAELYGMADHLTMPMAHAGYKVYKYVPYGPVRETIQYLARRAVENGSIMSGSVDVPKMQAELKDRLFPNSAKK